MQDLSVLLHDLTCTLPAVENVWHDPLSLSGFHVRHLDVVCMVSADPDTCVHLPREAYLSLLAFGDALDTARDSGIDPRPLVAVWTALHALLDAIEPYVSRADISLRGRQGQTLEETVAWIAGDGQ